MKSTLYLDDQVYRRAKAQAALEGKSFRGWLEEIVRARLTSRDPDWVARLPPLPPGAAREVAGILDGDPTFETIDQDLWR